MALTETPDTYIFEPLAYTRLGSYSDIISSKGTLQDTLPLFLNCNWRIDTRVGELDLASSTITSLCNLPPLGVKENIQGFIEKIMAQQTWVKQGYAFLFNEEYLRLRETQKTRGEYGSDPELYAVQYAAPFFTCQGFKDFKGTPEDFIVSMVLNYLRETLFDPYEVEFGFRTMAPIKARIEELHAEKLIYGTSYMLMGTILQNVGKYMNHATLARCVLAGITIFTKVLDNYFNLEDHVYALSTKTWVPPVFNTAVFNAAGNPARNRVVPEASTHDWEVNLIHYGLRTRTAPPPGPGAAFDTEGMADKVTREIHAVAMLGYMAPSKEFLQVFAKGLTVLSMFSTSYFLLACISALTEVVKSDAANRFPTLLDAGPVNTDFILDELTKVNSYETIFDRWSRVTRKDGV